MELILKTNDETSIAKIIALAKELHVVVEKRDMDQKNEDKEALRNHLLNFKATGPSSISDPVAWQREQREDRDLPFRK